MPWTAEDAKEHTDKADTPKKQRAWARIANAVLRRCEGRGGDDCEAQAVRAANAFIKTMAGDHGELPDDYAPPPEERLFVPFSEGLDSVLIFPLGRYWRGDWHDFSRDDGAEMVANFGANVLERRGGRLPVNREHERARGRIAYITDLWLADDGPRAAIEPLPQYAAEVGGFDYLSPEVVWHWTHPHTGKEYRNVLFGAGLTNYPYLLGRMALHATPRVWTAKGWAAPRPVIHEVTFAKRDDAERITYGVVVRPDVADAQGDTMTAAEVEAACHAFMEQLQLGAGPALDEHHARLVGSDGARIVECWIQREAAVWRLAMADGSTRETEVKPGDWCLGVRYYSDELWEQVRRGEIAGYSPRGWALAETVED
jgi:hypothetical protein